MVQSKQKLKKKLRAHGQHEQRDMGDTTGCEATEEPMLIATIGNHVFNPHLDGGSAVGSAVGSADFADRYDSRICCPSQAILV